MTDGVANLNRYIQARLSYVSSASIGFGYLCLLVKVDWTSISLRDHPRSSMATINFDAWPVVSIEGTNISQRDSNHFSTASIDFGMYKTDGATRLDGAIEVRVFSASQRQLWLAGRRSLAVVICRLNKYPDARLTFYLDGKHICSNSHAWYYLQIGRRSPGEAVVVSCFHGKHMLGFGVAIQDGTSGSKTCLGARLLVYKYVNGKQQC